MKGAFDVEPGNGGERDAFLNDNNIETFLIVGRSKQPQSASTTSSVPALVVERNASQQPFPAAALQQNSKLKSTGTTAAATAANFVAAADQVKTNGVQYLLHTLSETESNEDQDWKPEIPFGNVRMEF